MTTMVMKKMTMALSAKDSGGLWTLDCVCEASMIPTSIGLDDQASCRAPRPDQVAIPAEQTGRRPPESNPRKFFNSRKNSLKPFISNSPSLPSQVLRRHFLTRLLEG